MVEVAGIEPASEGLQLAKTTCVSGSLGFASATYEPARARAHYPLSFGRSHEEGTQPILLCVAPARPRRKERRDVAAKQPVLTVCYQQLYLGSTIFTSRGQLGTPPPPHDPRRIQNTPIGDCRCHYNVCAGQKQTMPAANS